MKSLSTRDADNDLLLNFHNEPEIYNLLPSSIPPISPSISNTTTTNQKGSMNCFLDSFKKEKEDKQPQYQSSNDYSLKRKRLISNSNSNSPDAELLSPAETTRSTSFTLSNSSSPPNTFETNLNFIKEMLSNLKENNFGTEPLKDDSLRLLCESVKVKLETNSYQSLDDLNSDINLIKEEYNSNSIGVTGFSNKRLKFSSCHINSNPSSLATVNEDLC